MIPCAAGRLTLPAMLVLLVAGCATPNVQPFADATVELRRAVVEGGAATADGMAAASASGRGAAGNEDAARFTEIWQQRVRLLDVLVAYSDSLANLASAGTESRRTAEAFGDSVKALADLVPSSGAAVNAGVDLGERLIATGIEIKAFHDLGRAVGAAHPTLVKVAAFLQADLSDIKRLYLKAIQDVEAALDDEFGRRESDRRALMAKRDELRRALTRDFSDAHVGRLQKIEELVAHTAPEHQEYVARREALAQKRVSTALMFDTAAQGVAAWLQSHRELQLALAQNRRPNVRLILSTAMEIREAVERVRKG